MCEWVDRQRFLIFSPINLRVISACGESPGETGKIKMLHTGLFGALWEEEEASTIGDVVPSNFMIMNLPGFVPASACSS